MRRSLEEVRNQGLEALRERLGRAGMIRFLQQFETGFGDYSQSRQDWVDGTSLEAIQKAASPLLSPRRRPRKRRSNTQSE